MKRKMRLRPIEDAGILERLARALKVDLTKPYARDCSKEGHSFDSVINETIYCSLCGKTKEDVDALGAAGCYNWDAIKYLDER